MLSFFRPVEAFNCFISTPAQLITQEFQVKYYQLVFKNYGFVSSGQIKNLNHRGLRGHRVDFLIFFSQDLSCGQIAGGFTARLFLLQQAFRKTRVLF
jgi:hypothetical protein